MNLKQGCPFCFPNHEVYVQGKTWRMLCTDEPDHYVLVPKEHLTATTDELAKARALFEALYYLSWPMEIVIHLNGYHTSIEHLHVHVYRKE